MQIANVLLLRTCLGCFVMPQGVSGGLIKCIILLPFKKLVECEGERQRAIRGGLERLVEAAFNKMSTAP